MDSIEIKNPMAAVFSLLSYLIGILGTLAVVKVGGAGYVFLAGLIATPNEYWTNKFSFMALFALIIILILMALGIWGTYKMYQIGQHFFKKMQQNGTESPSDDSKRSS